MGNISETPGESHRKRSATKFHVWWDTKSALFAMTLKALMEFFSVKELAKIGLHVIKLSISPCASFVKKIFPEGGHHFSLGNYSLKASM